MNISNVDRDLLKSVVLEMLSEKPQLLKDVLKELLSENSSETNYRKEKLIKMIDEDFDKYDDVFKALA